jgi:hypothetical protein
MSYQIGFFGYENLFDDHIIEVCHGQSRVANGELITRMQPFLAKF